MFRTPKDFLQIWKSEAENTERLLGTLTDESLAYGNAHFPRGVGRTAQHLVESIPYFMNMIGDTIEEVPSGLMPNSSAEVREGYARVVEATTAAAANWTDDSMAELVPFFGNKAPRGMALFVMVNHQTHHRGQLHVLAREAGLPSVSVYGPTREDHIAMGREPQA